MDRIIEIYCRPELLEDLQGDLHEYYERNLEKGRRRANLIFLLDVLKFCRTYTIQGPKIIERMTFFNLIGNYFKTSARSLARNRLFSAINIIGLAISMSIGILMIAYINELMSFDTFHTKADRTYRVLSTYQNITGDEPFDLASTSVFIGKKLEAEYTGFEKILLMRRNLREDLAKGDNVISVRGHYASEEFFNIFSFRLISGNPQTALVEPNSLVLTEKTAKKLFQEKDPVGEIVTAGENSYTITGVVEDIPTNSHMQFEALASFKTIENRFEGNENTTFFNWGSIWMNYVYLLLPEGQGPESVNASLNEIAAVENEKTDRYTITHRLENILKIVPGEELSNSIGPSMSWTGIWQLTFLTLFVIISACFNYTNLSIARSLRRAKEVGVRKVVGAGRGQIFTQFIFEAIIVALISLVISYGLFLVLKPVFMELILEDRMLTLEFQWIHVLYFILFAVFIGFIAGILPSTFLSRLKAISVFRDASKLKLFKGVSLRKVLIVFQFTISIFLIIGSTISYKQYMYALNFDLGFSTENVLNLSLKENDSELFMNELSKLPEVSALSRSGMVSNTGEVWGEDVKYKDPLDSASIYVNFTDRDYFALHDFEFIAGGTFPFNLQEGDAKFIVIDELLRKRFNFETPESAVGEVLTIMRRGEDLKLEIAGVINEFQYEKIDSEPEPCGIIQATNEDYQFINLKVKTDDVVALMGKLEGIWKEVDKVHPFEAVFYDELIQEAYKDQAVMFKLFGFLAFLAISIAAMGLLGMAVYTTETRLKEISVRKVMGATERNLIFILSKGFIFMLLISAGIAMPLTYLFYTELVLVDYVNRVTIGLLELLSGVILVFSIGILTISWQTKKAARTNPAEMLRNE
ncbi:MAG: ABC transporter permease [Cyclobacteriaceae bacterium]